ncbi:hypothetical protein AgCh_018499 [Apium graveolens]
MSTTCRDGVAEGQFYHVLLSELDAIRKVACASLEQDYQPPVTFVEVQKSHRIRLFANNHHDHNSVDMSGNILPVPPVLYAHLAAYRARYYMEPETSDSESFISGNAAIMPLLALKENFQRLMYFC